MHSAKAKMKISMRAKIIALSNEGRSSRFIGKVLGTPKSTVNNARNKYKATGSLEDRLRKGRPRVTTRAKDKSIVLSCKRDRKLKYSNEMKYSKMY